MEEHLEQAAQDKIFLEAELTASQATLDPASSRNRISELEGEVDELRSRMNALEAELEEARGEALRSVKALPPRSQIARRAFCFKTKLYTPRGTQAAVPTDFTVYRALTVCIFSPMTDGLLWCAGWRRTPSARTRSC